MADTTRSAGFSKVTPETLRVKDDLQSCKKALASFQLLDLSCDLCEGRDTFWLRIATPDRGGVALRTLFGHGPHKIIAVENTYVGFTCRVQSDYGVWSVNVETLGEQLLRCRVVLTPTINLLIPFWPRDLYVLGPNNDPNLAKGRVEAAQRGYNTGLCYFCLEEPALGTVLYVQNLSALNPYFKATATKPDGVVGGEWPELGYQPPASPNGNSPPVAPLKAGVDYIVSDALLAFREDCAQDEVGSARRFVDMIADVYPHLDRPEPEFHDWVWRAHLTVQDLKTATAARITHYGYTYLHPYTASEYPDSMVQMSVAAALDEMEALTGRTEPFVDELLAGMGRFYDNNLGTIRRYLPNVGKDKDANAVDSWYLYHPLMNLARVAIRGHEKSRKLFTNSLAYAVRCAHHFKYIWPIQFDVRDFSVITETRGDGYGQTDVAGIYAYVMLQAYQLTDDETYLKEARAALKACEGMRFELVYQANLSAWGLAACVKLWLIDEDERYLSQAQVFLASFVHNSVLWHSEIEHAVHYNNFFGVTCLHDAPYMAAYECFESFAAFDEALQIAGDDFPPKMKLLMAEFRRFAFDRSWAYYPDGLPEDAVAKDDIRNGYIDRKLSFPMEDLYADGQIAGQVGQEIYGSGGAFIIAARGFHQRDIPFTLFSDYPYSVVINSSSLQMTLKGPPNYLAQIRLLPDKSGATLPEISVDILAVDSRSVRTRKAKDVGRIFEVPADGVVVLSW